MYLYLKEILTLLGHDRRILPVILLLFILLALIELVGIGLMAPYVAFIASPESVGGSLAPVINTFRTLVEPEMLLVVISFCLVIIFATKSIFGIWISNFITKFSMQQQTRLREKLMHAHQSISYEKYLSLNSAEFVYDMQTLVPKFAENVLFFGLKAISSGIMAIAISGLLVYVDSLAFISMIGILVLFGFFYDRFFQVKAKNYGILANRSAANMVKGVNESNDGIKEIRVLGCERYFFDFVRGNSIKFGRFNTKTTIMALMPRYILELILVIFLVSFVLSQQGTEGGLATIILFTMAGLRLVPTTNEIVSALIHLRVGRDAVSRLHNNLHKQQDNQMSSQVECTKEILIKSIVLKNVEYSYPNSDFNALSEINLKIDSGESIGFIGASGSGKTTLVDILLGLLIPKTGEVLLNDEPLNNSIRCWHDNIAYLPQQVFIIDNTLRANIALGEDENKIDQIKLNNAIKKANLCELVDQLPMGVDTVLGERGARLSGGQRQRVALARAFYYERDVLIMDESTSALDNETELEIIEEIKQLKGEKTIIVIAHRLTTVRYCDRIYKMEKGRIVNIGTPQEVLNEGY